MTALVSSSTSAARVSQKTKQQQADIAFEIVGDSTSGYGTSTQYRWAYQFMLLFAAAHPEMTVLWYQWSGTVATAYDAPTTIQTGTGTANAGGPYTARFYNASVSGTNTLFAQAPNFMARVITPDPDVVIINHGHNEGVFSASNTTHSFRARYFALTEKIREAVPKAAIVCIAQNPTIAPAAAIGDQEKRAREIARICEMRGYGYVDVCQAFLNIPAAARWQYYENNGSAALDGIHPNAAGGTLWAQLVYDALFSAGDGQPRPQAESSLTGGWGQNLLTNGNFLNLDPVTNAPVGWTVAGTIAFSKDTTNVFDPAVGYSLRMIASGAAATRIYQTNFITGAALAPYLGKRVTFLVPMRLNAGAAVTTAGRVAVDDGVASTNGITDSWTFGDWVLRAESHYVDPTATYLRASVYCDSAAVSTTDISIGGAYLVVGDVPKKAVSVVSGPVGPAAPATYTYVRYTASDTFVVPLGISTLQRVRLLGGGGGGGGGGSPSSTILQAGGGGGGAGAVIDLGGLAVTPGESLTITIPAASGGGAGGASGGNAGTAGTAGSTVSVKRGSTVLVAAQGGAGGAGSAASSTTAANGGLPGPSTSQSSSSGIVPGGGGVAAATVVLPSPGGQACGGGGGGAATATNGGGGGGSATDMTQPGNTVGRGTGGTSGASGTTAGVNGTAATLTGCGGGGGGGGANGGKGGDGGAGSTGVIEIWY